MGKALIRPKTRPLCKLPHIPVLSNYSTGTPGETVKTHTYFVIESVDSTTRKIVGWGPCILAWQTYVQLSRELRIVGGK